MNAIGKKTLFWMALALLVMLLMGCGAASSNDIQLVDTDNGGQVKIKQGQSINLRLEANPTTGFGWEVSQVDAQILTQKGEKAYEEAAKGKPVVGGGGWEIFHFDSLQKGDTTLTLIYHRAWEKDVPPVKTYEVKVRVE